MSSTSLCNEIPEHHTISTLDQLELGSYLWHHNSVYNFEETIREFDQFHDFLGSTLKNSLYNLDEAQKYQLILKLNELQTCLEKTLTLVSKTEAKVKGDSTFQCSYCNEVVTVNPYKEPFWKAIQSHEHFEFLLMGKLSYAIPDLHAETEQLETEAQSEVVEDFKFNFQPSYDETVENIIYPSHLLDTVFPVDNVSDYTVQNRYTSFYCLLCKLELTSNMSKVVSHINELAHQKKFTDPDCMDSLNIYHAMWIKASPIYQSHQVFFNPEDVTVMKCLLCESSVRYDDLHLHLNGDSHMRNAFKFVNQLDTPSDEQKSLINLQMEIYGNFNNLLENVEGEIENPDFKETSSNVLPLTEQPISVASSVKRTGTKNNTINNMSADQPFNISCDGINPVLTTPNDTHIDEKIFNAVRKNNDNSAKIPTVNFENLMNEVYPLRFIQWGNTIQYRGEHFCLICNYYIGMTGEDHLGKHDMQMYQQHIETYNDFWKNASPIHWVHQIFFNLYSITYLYCWICRELVYCSGTCIVQHLKNATHFDLCRTSKLFLNCLQADSEMGRMLQLYVSETCILKEPQISELHELTEKKLIPTVTSETIKLLLYYSECRKLGADYYYISQLEDNIAFCHLCAEGFVPTEQVVLDHIHGAQHLAVNYYLVPNFNRSVFCIPCARDIRLTKTKILLHLQEHSQSAFNGSQTCDFIIHQELWSKIPSDLYFQKICFRVVSDKELLCTICNYYIQHSKLLDHMQGLSHQDLFEKIHLTHSEQMRCMKSFNSLPSPSYFVMDKPTAETEREIRHRNYACLSPTVFPEVPYSCLFELKLFGVDYYYIGKFSGTICCRLCSNKRLSTINILSQHLNGAQHLKRNCYLVPHPNNKIFCLLCGHNIALTKQSATEHLMGRKHVSNLSDATKVSVVTIYKQCWSLVPKEYHYQQICFQMVKNRIIKCLFCDCKFDCIKLFEHILEDRHETLFERKIAPSTKYLTCLKDCKSKFEEDDVTESATSTAELQHFPEQSRPSSKCSEIITSENVSARSDNSSCEDLSDSSVYQGPNKNKMKFLMRRITAEDPLDCAEGINSHFYETDSVPEQTTEGENVNFDVAMSDSESEANSSEVEETRNVPIEQLPEPSSTQLNRYHPDVEEHLFAWHLSQALNQDMKNSYLAARFIGKWLYCIPCGRKIDLKSWDAHCSGRRHNKRNFMLVDLFHTKCMKLPRAYQAHTLYILPDTKINVGEQRASCHICLINFSYNDLKRHIETLFHKQHFILLLMCHRKNHLMQHNLLQIQLEIFQGYEFSIMKLEKYIAGQIYYSEFRQHYLTMLGSQSGNLEMAAAITEINQKAYFCIFCRYNCQLRSWKEHLLSGGHFRKSSKNIICSPRLNCWRYVPQCFQKDRIHFIFSRKGFHCLLCRNENSTRNFQQHITGEAHMKYLFVYTVSLNYEKTNPFEIYFSNPEVSVENCGTKFDALGTYHRSSSNQHVPEPQPQIHGIYSQERSRASSRYSERSMNENTPEETVRSSFEDLTDAGVYKRPNKSQITNQGLITKETDYVSEHRVERENAVFDVATNDSEFKDVEGTRNLPMEELLGPSSTQLIRYHPDVEQHLFPVHLSQTSNQDMKCSYLAARSIGRKSYCLPCGRKMDLKSWNTHCTGKKHSNCNFTLFEIFHRKCMELPRSYQAHTLYFVPDTKSYVGEPRVLCLICVTNFTYNDFKSHIDTILHKQYFILLLMCHTDNNLMKHNLVQIQMGIFQDSELSITHLEHFVNDQICYSEFKLHYWNLLNDQSSNPEITVAVTEKNQKAYFCIFCRHNYCQLPSWKGHLNSKEHLRKLKKNIYLTRLDCWKNLPQCCQKDQIHFIFSKKNFHCLLCRKSSSINTFQQHIADEGHIYYLYVYTITMNYGRTNAFDLYMSDPNVSVENSHIKFDAVYLQDSSKQYIPGTCVNQGLFDKENESVSNKQIATDESEAEGENSSGSCEFIENIKVEEKQSPSNWQMENLPGPSTIVTELFPSNLLANLGHNFKS